MDILSKLLQIEQRLNDFIASIETGNSTLPLAPLTSTSWDGDARSTTAKTSIDMSAVFGVPNGVRAVYVRLYSRDSGSASSDAFVGLSPNSTASSFMLVSRPGGLANDAFDETAGLVTCDANGDLYYACYASGVGTLDVWLEITGYEF